MVLKKGRLQLGCKNKRGKATGGGTSKSNPWVCAVLEYVSLQGGDLAGCKRGTVVSKLRGVNRPWTEAFSGLAVF